MAQNQVQNPPVSWERTTFEPGSPVRFTGLSGAAAACAVARIYSARPRPVLIVVPDAKAADAYHGDLAFFLGASRHWVERFPGYNLQPFKFAPYHNETAASRIRVLYRLLEAPYPPLVVASAERHPG